MNIAMLTASSAAWGDGVLLGPEAVGGWSDDELGRALEDRFACGVRAVEGARVPGELGGSGALAAPVGEGRIGEGPAAPVAPAGEGFADERPAGEGLAAPVGCSPAALGSSVPQADPPDSAPPAAAAPTPFAPGPAADILIFLDGGFICAAMPGCGPVRVARADGSGPGAARGVRAGGFGPGAARDAQADGPGLRDTRVSRPAGPGPQPERGVLDVARVLARRLERVMRWEYGLREAARQGDAGALLKMGVGLVGRSLILFDGAFNLAGFSLVEGEDSPAMREAARLGYAAEVTEEHQARYRALAASHPEGFEILYPEPDRVTPMWSEPVEVAGETYRLHVMGAREGDAGTVCLARRVAEELRHVLEREAAERIGRPSDGGGFVRELLRGVLGEEEAAERARFFGWTEEGPWVAARAEPAGREFFPAARWAQVCAALAAALPGMHAAAAPDQGGAALVVPCGAWGSLGGSAASGAGGAPAPLARVCAAEGVVLGWGDPTPSLAGLRASYEQAGQACRMARARGAAALPFDACKLDVAAEALGRLFADGGLEPLALRALDRHDADFGTEYARTLRACLACEMVKADACRELHVHRTTLDYRLQRLRELFGIDLADARTRALMRLALMARGGA